MQDNKTRFFYVVYSDKTWVFDQSERAPDPIYTYILISFINLFFWSCHRLLNQPVFLFDSLCGWNKKKKFEHLYPKGLAKLGNIVHVADANVSHSAARETYVQETNFAARKQKLFLPQVKNIFATHMQNN